MPTSTLIAALLIIAMRPQTAPFVRTSDVVGGYCALSKVQTTGLYRGADAVFLGRSEGERFVPVLQLPVNRYEPEGLDKVIVSGDRIVILVRSKVGALVHFFIRRGEDGIHRPMEGAFGGGHFGSHNAIVVDGYVLGTVWISPDLHKDHGNYLYVFSKGGLKFGRLPQLVEGYEISKSGTRSFYLDRWQVNDRRTYRSRHSLPFAMSNGAWKLDFSHEVLIRTK